MNGGLASPKRQTAQYPTQKDLIRRSREIAGPGGMSERTGAPRQGVQEKDRPQDGTSVSCSFLEKGRETHYSEKKKRGEPEMHSNLRGGERGKKEGEGSDGEFS